MNAHEILSGVNKSELIQMARASGAGNASRSLSREELIELLADGDECEESELEPWRRSVEAFCEQHPLQVASDLTQCNKKCTSFGCPDLVVARCFWRFEKHMI